MQGCLERSEWLDPKGGIGASFGRSSWFTASLLEVILRVLPLSFVQHSRQTQAVPLITWGYAVGFAMAIFWILGTIILYKDPPRSEAFHYHNAARLERLAAKTNEGALGVVMLGDSRMRYATYADERLGAALSDHLERPAEVVRLVNNWAVMDDFTDLAPLIFEAKPGLVVFQEGLLSKERAARAKLLVGRTYLIWRFFGLGLWNPGNQDQNQLQLEARCEVLKDEDVESRRERVGRWVSFDPDGDSAHQATSFLAEAESRGIRVVFLAIPITSAGREGLSSFERGRDLKPLVIPAQIPDDSFCDVVHMNPQGREAYSAWFITTLGNLLKGIES